MNAADILAAIRAHHRQAAIVPEVVLDDVDWLEHWTQDEPTKSTRRIDALMFRTLERTAIEIKVSRADFARDTWQKRRPWVRVTHRFIYAVPKGLINPASETPYGCGLWEIDDSGAVTVARKAQMNKTPEPLPQQVVQALAYRASGHEPPTAPTTAVQATLMEAS